MNTKPFSQLCCEEPFRILLPAGLLIGVSGVLLWPLFYLGAGISYPSVSMRGL